jgi:hypothetical protein
VTTLPTTCTCGAARSGIQERRVFFTCGTSAMQGILGRWRVRMAVKCYFRRIWG